jgi:hypothetical protein
VLAWIGDSVAREVFVSFRDAPPTWAPALYLAPHAYTLTAGWTLRADGSRRDLYLPEGRALERSPAPSGPVRVLGLTEDRCRFCDNPLGTLFEMDTRDPELAFVPARGDAFPIPFCHLCSCFGTLFFRVDPRGRPEWHAKNERFPTYNTTFSPWTETLALGRPLVGPLEFAGWVDADVGHIGGCPGWIQDHFHPECPDCSQHMTFVGQVDVASAGRFYALACFDCRTVATTYQQT